MDPENISSQTHTPEVSSSTASQKKPFVNTKIVGYIVLLIVIGVVGYLVGRNNRDSSQITRITETRVVTPTGFQPLVGQDLTKDWETYHSSYSGISFKYPNNGDWKLVEEKTASDVSGIICIKCLPDTNILRFGIFPPEFKTIDEVLSNYAEWNDSLDYEEYTLDGVKAYKIATTYEDKNKSDISIYFHHDGKPYILMIGYKGIYKKVRDFPPPNPDILSTFKFVDSNNQQTVECGGWDTSGEFICECSGRLIKPTCPPNTQCDSASYICEGECGKCCYDGIAENVNYPKCNK